MKNVKRSIAIAISTVLLGACASAESSVTISKDATRGERIAAFYKWLDGEYPEADRKDVLDIVDQICNQLSSDTGTRGDFIEIAGFMKLPSEYDSKEETIAKQGMQFLCPEWVFMAKDGQK